MADFYRLTVKPYVPKEPVTTRQFIIEAWTQRDERAGWLGFTESRDYVRIGYIDVAPPWRGRGCSDALMRKLVALAGDKIILSGQVNAHGQAMLERMQQNGTLMLEDPPCVLQDISWKEIVPVGVAIS